MLPWCAVLLRDIRVNAMLIELTPNKFRMFSEGNLRLGRASGITLPHRFSIILVYSLTGFSYHQHVLGEAGILKKEGKPLTYYPLF